MDNALHSFESISSQISSFLEHGTGTAEALGSALTSLAADGASEATTFASGLSDTISGGLHELDDLSSTGTSSAEQAVKRISYAYADARQMPNWFSSVKEIATGLKSPGDIQETALKVLKSNFAKGTVAGGAIIYGTYTCCANPSALIFEYM